jgi:iduronate 2-sulfatase
VFRKAGYTTISNGEIHHNLLDAAGRSWSKAPWQPRNHMRSFDPETTRRLSKTKQRGRIYELTDVADDAYPDGETAQKTIKDLQRLKQEGKPFFLACGFFRPHMPFYAPKKYWDLYPRDSIQLATNRQRPAKAPEQRQDQAQDLHLSKP